LLLFDVDGTLMDAAGAGRAAMEGAMLEVYGDTGPIDQVEFDGRTDPEIVRMALRLGGFEDARIDAGLHPLWEAYHRLLPAELRVRRKLVTTYPGVPELTRRLDGDPRFQLGLLTGNVERGAWLKLGACNLDGRFSFGAFGSDAEQRKDLPAIAQGRALDATGSSFAREDTIVIGDTPEDISCARAGGTRVLAVATGRFSVRELEDHEADWVLPGFADVDAVLDLLAAA